MVSVEPESRGETAPLLPTPMPLGPAVLSFVESSGCPLSAVILCVYTSTFGLTFIGPLSECPLSDVSLYTLKWLFICAPPPIYLCNCECKKMAQLKWNSDTFVIVSSCSGAAVLSQNCLAICTVQKSIKQRAKVFGIKVSAYIQCVCLSYISTHMNVH